MIFFVLQYCIWPGQIFIFLYKSAESYLVQRDTYSSKYGNLTRSSDSRLPLVRKVNQVIANNNTRLQTLFGILISKEALIHVTSL